MRRDVQKEEGSLSGCPQPFCLACPLVSILPFVLGLVVWACPQLTAFSREKGQDCRPLCLLVQLIASSPCWEAGGLCRDLGTRGIVCFIFDLPVVFFFLSALCIVCFACLCCRPKGSDCGIVNVNIPTSGAEIGGAFGEQTRFLCGVFEHIKSLITSSSTVLMFLHYLL